MGELLASIGFAAPIALIIILILERQRSKQSTLVEDCPYNEWYCSHNGGCEKHKSAIK